MGDMEAARSACESLAERGARVRKWRELLQAVAGDVAYAFRQLSRAKLFAASAVVTLALGIGANAALFSVLEAAVLRPLPGVRAPERLATVAWPSVSLPVFRALREGFPSLAASSTRTFAVSFGQRTELVDGAVVSDDYLGRWACSCRPAARCGRATDSRRWWPIASGGGSCAPIPLR